MNTKPLINCIVYDWDGWPRQVVPTEQRAKLLIRRAWRRAREVWWYRKSIGTQYMELVDSNLGVKV